MFMILKNLLDSYFYPQKISDICFLKKEIVWAIEGYVYWPQYESFFFLLSIRAKDEIKEKEKDLGT